MASHSAQRVQCRRLSSDGFTNREIAKQMGVPYGTVGYWLHLDRAAGLLAPLSHHTMPECPRCLSTPTIPADAATYCYLLGQYLGDGHIVVTDRNTVLRIYCTSSHVGIIDECRSAILRTLGRSVHLAPKRGCTAVCAYHRHWTCLFPQHGPGMKHTRRIVLADWQEELVATHPRPFLRGLIHADGCRSVNRVTRGEKVYEYPRYFFANESSDILRLCGETLDRVGAAWRFNRRNSISVATREAVALLDEFIGPKK
ncbi:hypothetical protein LX16_1405 [Stackebrandtia albiflava]|uniref:DOD-type homing endonuclease domain-containing protein n=1 Tax=Stackebrandtia albiflava TaxID=406432 RepID=A0A562VCS1_9ACTN|nr:sigma-70 region 4 domain-containing protein [Stackebrandtia albiflava]TWJ15693.1 hypothetical protein LX16_1405 [Stackebrandtia albiflava]